MGRRPPDETLILLGKAEEADDLPSAARFIREARANLELLGRVAGILEPSTAIAIDTRRQFAFLSGLSEEDLRALARGDEIDGVELSQELSSQGTELPDPIARGKAGCVTRG